MQITLNRMKFYARHGVLPQETTVGAPFEVSLTLTLADTAAAGALCNDRLECTVNYAEVYNVVRREMSTPSALLEHAAHRLARAVLHAFAPVQRVEVALTKCTPPIDGYDAEGVTVHLERNRTLVVWDFDGTLADTAAGIVNTMRLTLQSCGVTPPADEVIRATIGLPLSESIALLTDLTGEALSKAVLRYRTLFETEGAGMTRLFAGVDEALCRQQAAGAFVAIATSRGHQSTEALCRTLGIDRYIDAIVACEDVTRSKPHAEPVCKLCQLFNVSAACTTVIGDTDYDIQMGLNAGAGSVVGVAWGNHTPERLLAAGAHRVVSSPNLL